MKIIWQTSAKEGRKQIATYIRQRFGVKSVRKFMQEVDKAAQILMRSPNIGQIDPLFADRPTIYRYIIVNSLSKLVYRIDGDIIHIVAFWDTRMEPEEQAARVK